MEEDKTKVTLEFDLQNNLFIGSTDANTNDRLDLSRRIIDSISETFFTMATAWLKEFDEKVIAGEFDEAFELFKANQDRLQFSKSPKTLESLLKLDTTFLSIQN